MEALKNYFITTDQPYKEGRVNVYGQYFEVENLSKATLTVTGLGVYEMEINHKKVGDQLFAPGYTYYPKDLYYQIVDITDYVKTGLNTLIAYLGQGWYCGRFTFNNKTCIYGDQTAISWIIDIEYQDGTKKQMTSRDEVVEVASPYDYAGFYDGEVYDANVTQDEIGRPMVYTGPIPDHLSQTESYVSVQNEVSILSVQSNEESVIIDFGQNFAGFIVIDPCLMDGAMIQVKHAEVLDKDGGLYTDNLRKAKAEITYKKGEETSIYRPRFTYMGFRYIEIRGTSYKEGLIKAYAIHNNMERTGYFESGYSMVNQLFENQVWGQKSNYVEVPTDCPQRDERMGYTGDGQVYAWTGAYNYNTELFWKKFLKDIRFSQMDNTEGYVGPTIPAEGPAGIGFLNMLGWGNAVTIIPYMLYMQYGNEEHLKTQYDSMKRFVASEINKMGDMHLWLGANLGDWLMLDKDMKWMATNNNPVSNSFIINDLIIMIKTAELLDYPEDAKGYEDQLMKSRAAYIQMFINEDGTMKNHYQGAYIMALQYVLIDGELRDKVMKQFVTMVREEGLCTGFFSTEFILPLLVEANEVALAFDILLSETCPGWMYQINRGATTTWERWDAIREDGTINDVVVTDDNMVSFNHYAFGSVGEFYYQYILGIKPLEPGYKKIQIKPYVDRRLEFARGSYKSVAGDIEVSWHIDKDHLYLSVVVPSLASILLPDGSKDDVEQGTYTYTLEVESIDYLAVH